MSFWDDVVNFVDNTVNTVTTFVQQAGGVFTQAADTVYNAAVGDVEAALNNSPLLAPAEAVLHDLTSVIALPITSITDAVTDISDLAVDVAQGNAAAAWAAAGKLFTDQFDSASTTIQNMVQTDVAAANTLIGNLTGINVSQDISDFVAQNASTIETIGEDAAGAALCAVGVPAPLAFALADVAADMAANGGKLDPQAIGSALGDALAGPLGASLGAAVAETAATGQLNLTQVVTAAAGAALPDAGEITTTITNAMESELGTDVGEAVGQEVSGLAEGALKQVATTGKVDLTTLGQSALQDAVGPNGPLAAQSADAQQWATDQLSDAAYTVTSDPTYVALADTAAQAAATVGTVTATLNDGFNEFAALMDTNPSAIIGASLGAATSLNRLPIIIGADGKVVVTPPLIPSANPLKRPVKLVPVSTLPRASITANTPSATVPLALTGTTNFTFTVSGLNGIPGIPSGTEVSWIISPVGSSTTSEIASPLAGTVIVPSGTQSTTITVSVKNGVIPANEQFKVEMVSPGSYSQNVAIETIRANTQANPPTDFRTNNLFTPAGQLPDSNPYIDAAGSLQFTGTPAAIQDARGQMDITTVVRPDNSYYVTPDAIGADIANVYISFINDGGATTTLPGSAEAAKLVADLPDFTSNSTTDAEAAKAIGLILGGGSGTRESTDIAQMINDELTRIAPDPIPGLDTLRTYIDSYVFTTQNGPGSVGLFLHDVAGGMTPDAAYSALTGKTPPSATI